MSPKKKFTFAALLASLAIGSVLAQSTRAVAREVRVYSGRHYNTDRQIFKRFSEETGIKVRLIEATGISLVERLKRNKNRPLLANTDIRKKINSLNIERIKFYEKANIIINNSDNKERTVEKIIQILFK